MIALEALNGDPGSPYPAARFGVPARHRTVVIRSNRSKSRKTKLVPHIRTSRIIANGRKGGLQRRYDVVGTSRTGDQKWNRRHAPVERPDLPDPRVERGVIHPDQAAR